MLENNNNMKKKLDYKNKLNTKEMNFKESYNNKNKTEKLKLNYPKKKNLWLKNTLKNLKNKFYKMKKIKNK